MSLCQLKRNAAFPLKLSSSVGTSWDFFLRWGTLIQLIGLCSRLIAAIITSLACRWCSSAWDEANTCVSWMSQKCLPASWLKCDWKNDSFWLNICQIMWFSLWKNVHNPPKSCTKKEKLQNLICNTNVLKFLSDSGLYSRGYAANI